MAEKRPSRPRIDSMSSAQRLAWVGTHDLRLAILTYLTEQGQGSPVGMSRAKSFSGYQVSTIAYHCRRLRDIGVISVEAEYDRRGATEHVYAPAAKPLIDTEEWREMHPLLRTVGTAQVGERAWADISEAVNAGTIDARDERHMTRIPAVVDEEGWQEVTGMLRDFYFSIEAALDRARGRVRDGGEQGIRISVTQLCFELPSQ